MPYITDPNEPYFKDGIWGWAATLWQRLISEGGRLFTALHGWDGADWHRLPMLWGYSDTYSETFLVNNVPAAHYVMNFSQVPAGQIWVVTNFTAYCIQNLATGIGLYAYIDGIGILLDWVVPGVAGVPVVFHGSVTLAEDDYLRATFYNCAANDDVRGFACGYKMLIAE